MLTKINPYNRTDARIYASNYLGIYKSNPVGNYESNPTMKTICINSNKGGAAKSTSSVNLAFNLRRRGFRVLLVDCDSQLGNSSFLVNKSKVTPNLGLVMMDYAPIQDAISVADSSWLGLSVIAGGEENLVAEIKLAHEVGNQLILKSKLEQVQDQYDWCVIDTPPTKSLIVLNALMAADYLIVPVAVGVLDFAGIAGIMELFAKVQQRGNPNLRLMGILLTRWLKNKLAKDFEKQIRGLFPNLVFQSVIPEGVAIGNSHANKMPVISCFPESAGAIAYQNFTNEVINHENKVRLAS